MSEIDESNKKTLIGSFFLGDHEHPWMGRVIEALGERGTYYFVECFASKATDVQSRRVVSVHEMSSWTFYGTVYQMRRYLVEAQRRWEHPKVATDHVHRFFEDMDMLKMEEGLTGERIYEAWLSWRDQRS